MDLLCACICTLFAALGRLWSFHTLWHSAPMTPTVPTNSVQTLTLAEIMSLTLPANATLTSSTSFSKCRHCPACLLSDLLSLLLSRPLAVAEGGPEGRRPVRDAVAGGGDAPAHVRSLPAQVQPHRRWCALWDMPSLRAPSITSAVAAVLRRSDEHIQVKEHLIDKLGACAFWHRIWP